jgi:hypothetical protein
VSTQQNITASGSSYKKERKKRNNRAHKLLAADLCMYLVQDKRVCLVQEKIRREELLADHRAAEARRKALEDAMQMERAVARIAAQNAELRWVQIRARQTASLWLQMGRCRARAGQFCRIGLLGGVWKIESREQKCHEYAKLTPIGWQDRGPNASCNEQRRLEDSKLRS